MELSTLFKDLLQTPYKTNRDRKAIMTALGNKELVQLFCAWSDAYIVEVKEFDKKDVPDDLGRRWEFLWSQVRIDFQQLQAASGLMEISARFRQLRNLRLIYPDGTGNQYLDQHIKNKAIRAEQEMKSELKKDDKKMKRHRAKFKAD